MSNSEQWKLDGDCNLCRRKNYCSKPCTRCKRVFEASIQRAVVSALDKRTGGAFSLVMEMANERKGGAE